MQGCVPVLFCMRVFQHDEGVGVVCVCLVEGLHPFSQILLEDDLLVFFFFFLNLLSFFPPFLLAGTLKKEIGEWSCLTAGQPRHS